MNFANNASTRVTNALTMQPIVTGQTFLAQLYYGPAGTMDDFSFISVTNPPVGFTLAGQILAGARSTTLPGGATGSFQIRVWEAVLGGSWETAYPNWLSGQYASVGCGKSGIIQVVTGDPNAIPPGTPASLVTAGLRGFYIGMPEPSTLALGAVGVAALWWYRRRKAS